MTSITESSNEYSTSLDVVDAAGIVQIFEDCDVQLFTGYKDYSGIFSEEFLDKAALFEELIVSSFRSDEPIAVVFTGAGCISLDD